MAIAAAAAGLTLLTSQPLLGQGRPPVSDVLPSLFGNTIVLMSTASTPDNPSHAAHFRPAAGDAARDVPRRLVVRRVHV
jgi:hypothetical protein